MAKFLNQQMVEIVPFEDMAQVLDEIENLTEEQVQRLLDGEEGLS